MSDTSFHLSGWEQAIADFVKSLASEEATLANILNSQDKIIKETNSSGYKSYELVAINNSISKVIKDMIKLEMLLQNRLSQVEKLLEMLENPGDDEEV